MIQVKNVQQQSKMIDLDQLAKDQKKTSEINRIFDKNQKMVLKSERETLSFLGKILSAINAPSLSFSEFT